MADDEQAVIRCVMRAYCNPLGVKKVAELRSGGRAFFYKLVDRIAQDGIKRGYSYAEARRLSFPEACEVIGVECPHEMIWHEDARCWECSICGVWFVKEKL